MATLVISYSRVDQPLVRAVVSLLQAALRDVQKAVFWDGELEPGEAWFEQLERHIDRAPQLFVFWCAHAATSHNVTREFTYALARKKRVVPVLLDDTPLCPELAPIHGIDLRGAVTHLPPPPAMAPAAPAAAGEQPSAVKSAPAFPRLVLIGVLLTILLALVVVTLSPVRHGGEAPSGLPIGFIGVAAALLLIALLLVRRWRRRRAAETHPIESPSLKPAPRTSISLRPYVDRDWIVKEFAPYLAADAT